MKRYQKIINNQLTIKLRKEIVVVKDGRQYINPSEEVILSDGWELYQPDVVEKTQEELDAEELKLVKRRLQNDVLRYDSSNDVNMFYVNDIPVWLDKATRAGLMLRFNAALATGKTHTSLWYNKMEFPLTIENAIQMLYALENYASECYDNTQRHISNIDKLTSIDELREYNYHIGYPEKLRF